MKKPLKFYVPGTVNKTESNELSALKDSETEATSVRPNTQRQQRLTWASQMEFFLSLVGYAVGLGNIWRFPYLCYRNGGGAFLIPYGLILIVCGIPLFFLEVALGQFSSRGAIDVWNFCPLFKGVGIGTIVVTLIGSTSYNLIVAYVLFFIFSSYKNPLPWGSCSNEWNTNSCVLLNEKFLRKPELRGLDINATNQDYRIGSPLSLQTPRPHFLTDDIWHNVTQLDELHSSTLEYWNNKVLKISSDLKERGKFNTDLFWCFLCAWVITYLCLIKGIQSAGKIVYVTATFPYIILTILLVRSITLPGAFKGVMFFFKPNWSLLTHFKVWNEAASQIFYSLGPGWSGLISMASYNKFRNNCLRDSIAVSLINSGTSIYAGVVVFSIIGFMSHSLNVPMDHVVTQGVGLAFIVYPEALLHLPFSNFWSFLFFFMLLTVGVDTMFVQMEVIYTVIYDSLDSSCLKKYLFNFVGCLVMICLGIPYLFQNGIYLFQYVDWYFPLLGIMTFCIFETVAISWIYGIDRFVNDIEFMLNYKLPFKGMIKFLWKILIPIILTVSLLCNVLFFVPVQYGNYKYDPLIVSLGWLISIVCLLPIPIFAFYMLFIKLRSYPFKQRLTLSLMPSMDWGPYAEPYKTEYNKAFNENSELA